MTVLKATPSYPRMVSASAAKLLFFLGSGFKHEFFYCKPFCSFVGSRFLSVIHAVIFSFHVFFLNNVLRHSNEKYGDIQGWLHQYLQTCLLGRPEGYDPSSPGPQPGVLPLNYDRHVQHGFRPSSRRAGLRPQSRVLLFPINVCSTSLTVLTRYTHSYLLGLRTPFMGAPGIRGVKCQTILVQL